jgi:hypothetical protein
LRQGLPYTRPEKRLAIDYHQSYFTHGSPTKIFIRVLVLFVAVESYAFVLFEEQDSYVLRPEPAIAAGADAVRFYYPLIAPAPQRIAVDMEQLAYFSYCEHAA